MICSCVTYQFVVCLCNLEDGLQTLSVLQDELALPVTVPLVSCMNTYSNYGEYVAACVHIHSTYISYILKAKIFVEC